MANDRDSLIGMGFDPTRVDWALKATMNRGIQPAMDHLFENEGQSLPVLEEMAASTSAASTARMTGAGENDEEFQESLDTVTGNLAEAKSIKCSQCGKTFRNTTLADYHARKSGHNQFEESTEEIKPLTEEEKQLKLAELRQRLSEKRAKETETSEQEQKKNEVLRRKAGKELNKLKEEIQVKQALKEAEDKKREKREDVQARAAVKAQIEADKKERAEKFAREKAIRDGQPMPMESTVPVTVPNPSTSRVSGGDFKETRLQIRMSNGGGMYTTILPCESSLHEVAEFMAAQSLDVDVETVSFAQNFPRKVFSKEEFSKTLRDLGLTPSAVLIATVP